MKRRRVHLDQWQREGTERFGPDPANWKFVCPNCGRVQSRRDFEALGMRAHQLETILAFSCIGGWLAMRHGQKPAEFGEFDQGFGCRYKGGLEPNISPVELMIDENEPRPTFEWAKE